MAEQVQAWKDSEGGLHATHEEAALADAQSAFVTFWQTKQVPGSMTSAEFAGWAIANAADLHAALDPLIRARKGPTMRASTKEA